MSMGRACITDPTGGSFRNGSSIGAGAGHTIPVSAFGLGCLLHTCAVPSFIVRTLAFGVKTHPNNEG